MGKGRRWRLKIKGQKSRATHTVLLITYEQKQKLRDFPLLAEKGSIPPEIIDIYKH